MMVLMTMLLLMMMFGHCGEKVTSHNTIKRCFHLPSTSPSKINISINADWPFDRPVTIDAMLTLMGTVALRVDRPLEKSYYFQIC